ncbi:energy-coupling factor ABC transporter ATP-binding protein [bacterium]|nr:energy-coupling factor ABC transporter ATP-binding protein [bacterium]
MKTDSALCATEVSYAYHTRRGKCKAVNSLSCKLFPGRVTAILGASGSGKSTLGLLLAGLLKPDSGEISFENNGKPTPKDIAYLFQFPEQLFSEETVEKELCRNGNVSVEEARRALENVGLHPDDFLQCGPFELSGGQARLVATAVQLARPSRAVIFDEPTAGLDWKMRTNMRRVIREQADEGKIVGLITHHLPFAASVSDEALVLSEGCVKWEGDPEQLLNDSEARGHLRI